MSLCWRKGQSSYLTIVVCLVYFERIRGDTKFIDPFASPKSNIQTDTCCFVPTNAVFSFSSKLSTASLLFRHYQLAILRILWSIFRENNNQWIISGLLPRHSLHLPTVNWANRRWSILPNSKSMGICSHCRHYNRTSSKSIYNLQIIHVQRAYF